MKRKTGKHSAEEVASDLSASCARVLSPVAKTVFRSGLGVEQFLLIARTEFAKAAAADIALSGQRPTLSRVAAATGLSRKDIASVIAGSVEKKKKLSRDLKLQPTYRVIDTWKRDARFRRRNGTPKDLPLDGVGGSFLALVRECAADIAPTAMARELLRMGAISKTNSGSYRLVEKKSLGTIPRGQALSAYGKRFSEFGKSILASNSGGTGAPFSEGKEAVIDASLVPLFMRDYQERCATLVLSLQEWVAARADSRSNRTGAVRVGIGAYVFDPSPISSDSVDDGNIRDSITSEDLTERPTKLPRRAKPA